MTTAEIAPSARASGAMLMPMLLVGLGIGALASQLGAVTVSAVPDDESPEVGGIQNTMTNLGASLGTTLAGSLLIATLTSAFLTNVQQSAAIPASAKEQAQVERTLKAAYPESAELAVLSDETRAIVSEPLGDLPGAWNEVPESRLGIVHPGADELLPLHPKRP
jgi:MFS family permease